MTWFKVDDTLSSHPKARKAGLAAMGLWAVSGAYSSQYLTGGFVPEWYVASWPSGKKLAAALVDAGLWLSAVRGNEKGWEFHQWGERQPTKEQVEADREATRKRQQAYRDKKRAKAVSNGEDNGVTNGVNHTAPTRPDPTRPVVPKGTTQLLPDDKSSDEPTTNAGQLVGEWIEHCPERPPGRVVGQVSKELKQMLLEGIPVATVREGLTQWHRKSLHPSVLPSIVHEVQKQRSTPGVFVQRHPLINGIADPRDLPPVEETWMNHPWTRK